MNLSAKNKLLLVLAAILIASTFLIDRVPQDPAYHQFVDGRTILAISNFWNVMSNMPFLAVGGAGLWFLRNREREGLIDNLYPAYIVFFIGIIATGFGSSWYHLAPNNDTLVWDRLAMTITFMALFAIVLGEHVCDNAARRLLIPLLLIGAGSVFYWQYTETTGAGDLRPYALVQFLPMILIPVILLAYRSSFGSKRVYWGMIALYVASKLFEHFDYLVYEAGNMVSGHSIKHLAAACAPAFFLYGLANRRLATASE